MGFITNFLTDLDDVPQPRSVVSPIVATGPFTDLVGPGTVPLCHGPLVGLQGPQSSSASAGSTLIFFTDLGGELALFNWTR